MKRKRVTGAFAELWTSTELSNVRIVLQPQIKTEVPAGRAGPWQPGIPGGPPPGFPGSAPPPVPPGDIVIFAHDTVLFVSSAYWKGRVLRWRQDAAFGGAGPAGAAQPMLLTEPVAVEELHAAQAVLRLMYYGQVAEEETSQPILLAQMMTIAERWQASTCTQLCMEEFAQFAKTASNLQVISQALPLIPESARVLPEYSAVAASTAPHLLGTFGNVYSVVCSQGLLQCWLDLPFAFVEQWASSDDLSVDSEDSVVVLLSVWLGGAVGGMATQEQEQRLSTLIRLTHVSRAYQIGVLPYVSWFEEQRQHLLECVTCMATLGKPLAPAPHLPPAWSARPRTRQLDLAALPGAMHKLEVSVMELWRAYSSTLNTDHVEWFASPPKYLAGTWWQLGLKVCSQPMGKGEHKLAAWVGLRLLPPPAAFTRLPRVRGAVCSFVVHHLPPNAPAGQQREVHRDPAAFVTYAGSAGTPLFPDAANSDAFNRHAIRDGKLTLMATITSVQHQPQGGSAQSGAAHVPQGAPGMALK